MSVIEHTVPFFLPIREAENDLLSSNAIVGLATGLAYLLLNLSTDICYSWLEIHRLCWRNSAVVCWEERTGKIMLIKLIDKPESSELQYMSN